MKAAVREGTPPPVALVIGGLDPSGGAGLAADLRALSALGVYAGAVATALTIQDTRAVYAVHGLEARLVEECIRRVVEDLEPAGAKTGMLWSADTVRAVARALPEESLLIVDPVFRASTGRSLLTPGGRKALVKHLFPRTTVLTPNREEAEEILGMRIQGPRDAEKAVQQLADLGPRCVVLKGGHIPGEMVVDYVWYEGTLLEIPGERVPHENRHGLGCTFAAALLGLLLKKIPLFSAIREARRFAENALRSALPVGKGRGPVNALHALIPGIQPD